MTLYQLTFFSFLIIFIGISIYHGKNQRGLGDFYNMGGSAGIWLICGTYTATLVSALGMVGLTGTAYADGPVVGILVWGTFIAFPITGLFMGAQLRRFGKVTIGDFLEERYESKSMRIMTTVITIIGMGCFFVSQLVGSALIVEGVLGIPYNYVVLLTVAVFVIIAWSGGSRTVTITDTIMFAMICLLLGFIFSGSLIRMFGISTYRTLAETRPALYTATDEGKIAWGVILGWQILWCFGNASNPANLTRCYLAKDGRSVTCAMMAALALIIPVIWLTHIAAAGVQSVNPNITNPSMTIIWAALNLGSPFIGALAIAGLFAAVLSTASTQILTLALCLSRDIYERFFCPAITPEAEKKVLFMTRMAILLFAVYGVIAAWGNPTIIVQIGNFGSSVFACTFFPVLLCGLRYKWATREAAIASFIVGFVVDGVLSLVPLFMGKPLAWAGYLPWSLHPVVWGFAASFAAMFIVSALTKPTATMDALVEKCMTVTPEENIGTPISKVKHYAYGMMAVAIIFYVAALWFAQGVGKVSL